MVKVGDKNIEIKLARDLTIFDVLINADRNPVAIDEIMDCGQIFCYLVDGSCVNFEATALVQTLRKCLPNNGIKPTGWAE